MRLTSAERKELVARDGELRARRLTSAERKEVVTREAAIARIAARQQGMVTTRQLRDVGFSDPAILRRTAGGWLVRRHRGVYQVGVFGGPFGREVAALLACGPRAVLSHETAAVVCELPVDDGGLVHVLGTQARIPGVRTHRSALAPTEVTLRHGLPITTPTRTLLDLASSMPAVELARLIEEAQVKRLITPQQLQAALDQAKGRPGVKQLRALVEPELGYTRSEAERRLRELIRAARLPPPRMNVRIAGLEVDALWRNQNLVVEVDGYAFHRTREAFERDRRRDARLLLAGYRVLRITWRRLTQEPEQVIALLAAALRA